MNWFKKKRIFLDYASATPVLPEVRREMEKYFSQEFYNPNAIYEEGVRVKKVVEDCRSRIAQIFGVAKEGVIFTSSGTEANTWAVRGLGHGQVLIDSESHPSMIEAAKNLDSSVVSLKEELPINSETILVSSVTTDNKIGRQVREWRRKHDSEKPLLHIDASQTAQYFNTNLESLSADLLTVDAAKLYGPKGIGALIVRRGAKIELPPLATPAVPLIVGFTKALEIAVRDREAEQQRLTSLSHLLTDKIRKILPEVLITEFPPNHINVSVPGILPELLVLALDRANLLVSAGPACDSNKPEPPETPVRFSLGRLTTEEEIKRASEIFCRTVQKMLK